MRIEKILICIYMYVFYLQAIDVTNCILIYQKSQFNEEKIMASDFYDPDNIYS